MDQILDVGPGFDLNVVDYALYLILIVIEMVDLVIYSLSSSHILICLSISSLFIFLNLDFKIQELI